MVRDEAPSPLALGSAVTAVKQLFTDAPLMHDRMRSAYDHYSEQRDRTEILTRKDAVLLVFSFALVFGMLASKQQHEQQQLMLLASQC